MNDALIAETGMILCETALGHKRCPCRETGVFACAKDHPGNMARAALAVIAPAVLEEAASLADDYGVDVPNTAPAEQAAWDAADAIRALKARYV